MVSAADFARDHTPSNPTSPTVGEQKGDYLSRMKAVLSDLNASQADRKAAATVIAQRALIQSGDIHPKMDPEAAQAKISERVKNLLA